MLTSALRILAVATLTCVGAAADPASALLPAGEYELRAQTYMPYLEEMRRVVKRERRCLAEDDVRGFFPVLAQPALRGCEPSFPRDREDRRRYALVCRDARVATGAAELARTRDAVVGELRVKMGGKNMTFRQRVEGRRLAPTCAAP